MRPVIEAEGLTKRYGAVAAVDGIDFAVEPGESFGLLGPNGAGKSTTMRMVGAVSTRSGGRLSILGLDPNDHGPEIRAPLGVVPQADNLDQEIRARDNLIVYLLALVRGGVYAAGFLIVMTVLGLSLSWTAVLALPAVLLIALGFASLGMGVASLLRTFQQMDLITLAMLPMFLFSATFYPISVYPQWIQTIIEVLPLWHGVELVRGLTTGTLQPAMWAHLAYFLVLIAFGLVLTTRRLRILFLA